MKGKRKSNKPGKGEMSKKPKASVEPVIVGTITVTAAGNCCESDWIATFAGGPTIWLVNNLHSRPHIVSIELARLRRKAQG